MDKRLSLKLNGGRVVSGILRGFDPFMNVVVDESIEECKDGTRNNIGMVVSEEEGWEGKFATLVKLSFVLAIVKLFLDPFCYLKYYIKSYIPTRLW